AWGGAACKPKNQPPADRIGFCEAHGKRVTEPEAASRMPPAQLHPRRVEAVEIGRQAGDRQEPVGAAVIEPHKKAEARDAADPAGKHLADPAAEQLRAITLDRGALGSGRTPFGCRDMLPDGVELVRRQAL